MNKAFEKSFSILEERKSRLFTKLSDFSNDQLATKPDENAWSILQVLDHLIYAEAASLAYTKRKMQAGDQLKDASSITFLRMSLYDAILRTPYRIKAPAVVASPKGIESLEKALTEFTAMRSELEEFLVSFPDKYLKKGVYRQPLAGLISAPQMIRFFDAHLKHHIYQIDRTLKFVS
jgi:hypothetical protein